MFAKGYKNEKDNYLNESGKKLEYLEGLKRLNIFVGQVNSGKSRFLREIYSSSLKDFLYFKDRNEKLLKIYQEFQPQFNDHGIMQSLDSMQKTAYLFDLVLNNITGDYGNHYNKLIDWIDSFANKFIQSNPNTHENINKHFNTVREEMQKAEIYEKYKFGTDYQVESRKLYIPIIRGVRHIKNDHENLYSIATNSHYELIQTENRLVYSGLEIATLIRDMKSGGKQERKTIENFEQFLSENFFEGRKVTLVYQSRRDVLIISFAGDDDREIYNVGDGIQSIIILTFFAFIHQDENIMLCIEEPEMLMHPGVQRILIETLIKFPNLQLFVTTHSNHFLDLTYDYPDDVAIFSFKTVDTDKFQVTNVTKNSEILDLLGIRNSSVFLSNCVIWTEGVTDRMLIKKLLALDSEFDSKFKEDYNYTFAEYGGSNWNNFDFGESEDNESINHNVSVHKISGKNFIVADNDGKKIYTDAKMIQREKVKSAVGEENFFDEFPEIENLIPFRIWKAVFENRMKLDRVSLNSAENKNKSLKDIQLKAGYENNETEFNNRLDTDNIKDLLKLCFIEVKSGRDEPEYFKKTDVTCLGLDKHKIMTMIIEEIDEQVKNNRLKLAEFRPNALKLIDKIKNFVKRSNNNA